MNSEELATPVHANLVLRAERTMKSLKRNRINSIYVEHASDVLAAVTGLLNEGDSVACGGSVTLDECGVQDLLRSGAYEYFDRTAATTPEAEWEVFHQAFGADVYLMSSNAVTENGELYNVDGRSNRVAALCYGPRRVIIVIGRNKIVRNLDEAVMRMKTYAAPSNATRLSCHTYCAEKGECVSLSAAAPMLADGCASPDRVCCNYMITAFQRDPNRLTVIICGDELGY